MRYEAAGASTATRAAIRAVRSEFSSSSQRATDSAVIAASVSRTGVSESVILGLSGCLCGKPNCRTQGSASHRPEQRTSCVAMRRSRGTGSTVPLRRGPRARVGPTLALAPRQERRREVVCSRHSIDPFAPRRRYRRAQAAAGLTPLRWHDLRHTFSSLLAAAGVDLVKIKAAMGHSNIATTERYLHARPASEQAAEFTLALERSRATTARLCNHGAGGRHSRGMPGNAYTSRAR